MISCILYNEEGKTAFRTGGKGRNPLGNKSAGDAPARLSGRWDGDMGRQKILYLRDYFP